MGGMRITVTARGWSMGEAFNNAVEEAREEHGNDIYNGTISTASGFTDQDQKARREKLNAWDYKETHEDDMSKHEGFVGLTLQEPVVNNNKIKSQVEVVRAKGTQKWVLKYHVTEKWRSGRLLHSCDSQGEAVKKARDYSERHKTDTQVTMVRVLADYGSNQVANITYKPSKKERPGEYLFFGVASC